MMKKVIYIIFSIALCTMLAGCFNEKEKQSLNNSATVELQLGVITGDDVFVREGPSTEYKSIAILAKGSKIEILDSLTNKKHNNLFVLVPDEFKAKDLETNSEIILHKGLALKCIESKGSSAICEIQIEGKTKKVYMPTGFGVGTSTVVEPITDANWYNVRLSNGKKGWVYGKFIEFVDKDDIQNTNKEIQGLPKIDELLGKDCLYGIHLHDDYDAAAKKFVEMGWKKHHLNYYEPGFSSRENKYGYTEKILYTPQGNSVTYYVVFKNNQAINRYYDYLEEQLIKTFGVPHIIHMDTVEIEEFDAGDKFFHINLSQRSLSVGMISKPAQAESKINYSYLYPAAL